MKEYRVKMNLNDHTGKGKDIGKSIKEMAKNEYGVKKPILTLKVQGETKKEALKNARESLSLYGISDEFRKKDISIKKIRNIEKEYDKDFEEDFDEELEDEYEDIEEDLEDEEDEEEYEEDEEDLEY